MGDFFGCFLEVFRVKKRRRREVLEENKWFGKVEKMNSEKWLLFNFIRDVEIKFYFFFIVKGRWEIVFFLNIE